MNPKEILAEYYYCPHESAKRNPEKMSCDIEGLVQTSLNLALWRPDKRGSLTYSVRSSMSTEKEALVDKLSCLTEHLEGFITNSGDYPAWEYRKESPLRNLMIEIFEKQYGKETWIPSGSRRRRMWSVRRKNAGTGLHFFWSGYERYPYPKRIHGRCQRTAHLAVPIGIREPRKTNIIYFILFLFFINYNNFSYLLLFTLIYSYLLFFTLLP